MSRPLGRLDLFLPAPPRPFSGRGLDRATLAYTLQLYFDFSGYSDMAIGLALIFGIRLPLTSTRPTGANIIDFWRRWHMTLSRFLRDYLYIPLGGNRHGQLQRYVNLMLTMLLGGLWHGANWTFVIWGALHGLYLCINHAWINYRPPIPGPLKRPAAIAAFLVTFLAVVVAWAFFRADSLASALSVLSRMADPGEIVFGRTEIIQSLLIAIYAAIAWFAPNTQEIVGYDHKNRLVGKNIGALRRPARGLLAVRWGGRVRLRRARHPAAQRIHLFPVLMDG